MKYTAEENRVLTEIFRRINYFKTNIDDKLIICGYPSYMKCLVKRNLVKPTDKEQIRVSGWYSLTEEGKDFFKDKLYPISDAVNLALYDGCTIDFNFPLDHERNKQYIVLNKS